MIKIPYFTQYTGWLPGLGLFICGMIVGSAVFMSIHHHNFNLLYDKYQDLLNDNLNLADENRTLTEYRNRQTIISKINIKLVRKEGDPPLDEIAENEIAKKVRDALKVYIGKPVTKLALPDDQDIALGLINKRFLVLDKDYTIQGRSLVIIHSELTVWISAKAYIQT